MINPRKNQSVLFALFLFVSGLALSQPAPVEPHGSMFFGPDIRSFRRPRLIENADKNALGKVDFPVSAKDPESQKFFNQAVGALFGYWYYEAERNFREFGLRESGHPMAWWGLSMTSLFFHGMGADVTRARFAEAVKQLSEAKGLTQREMSYLTALYLLGPTNKDGKENPERFSERWKNYADAMKQIMKDHPTDLAAKTFRLHALLQSMLASRGERSKVLVATDLDIDPLFKEIFAADPMYAGAHHQFIHYWDDISMLEKALSSAELAGQSAPMIAHMWHMPAHVYNNNPAKKAWHTQAALRVDHEYFRREGVLPYEIHNYFHDGQFLLSSLENAGEVENAVTIAKSLIREPGHPRFSRLGNSDYSQYSRLALMNILEINEAWEQAAELSGSVYFPVRPESTDEKFLLTREEIAFLRLAAIANARLGRESAYEQAKQRLEAEKIRQEKILDKRKAEADKARTGIEIVLYEEAMKQVPRTEVEVILKELAIHKILGSPAKGDERQKALATALKALRFHSLMPKYHLSQFYLELGDTKNAEKLLKESLAGRYNSLPLIARLVDVYSRDPKGAGRTKQWLNIFYNRTPRRDGKGGRVWERAKAVADALKIDINKIPFTDELKFQPPDLDAMGPLEWKPVPPPHDPNRPNPLDDKLKGAERATMVMFRLKATCEHCNQQLKRLESYGTRLKAAGVKVIVVSNDAQANLAGLIVAYPQFEFIADPEAKIFQWWGAYDEFTRVPDEAPLHGIYLADKNGGILWKDLSRRDPYNEFEFFVKEAERLLSMWAPRAGERAP